MLAVEHVELVSKLPSSFAVACHSKFAAAGAERGPCDAERRDGAFGEADRARRRRR